MRKRFNLTAKEITVVFIILLAFLLPLYVQDKYLLHTLILCFIWGILSISLDLTLGYTGQFNMAQAAFFGIGAYSSALLSLRIGISPWVGMIVAGLISSLAGLLIGFISLRA